MKQISIAICCLLCFLLQSTSGQSRDTRPTPAFLFSSPVPAQPFAPDHGGKIETKYDGFNSETVVSLKKMRITCGGASALNETCVSLTASLHCPGVQLDYVRHVTLQLIFDTKDWDRRHPLDQRDLIVVADGERLKLGTMALAKAGVDTSRLVDVMREVLEVSMSYQTFTKIARAETVDVAVGKTKFALQPKNIDALRDMNNRVRINSR